MEKVLDVCPRFAWSGRFKNLLTPLAFVRDYRETTLGLMGPHRVIGCIGGPLMQEPTITELFTEFVVENEPRLTHALVAALGIDVGHEAVAEAFAYGWEHWARVSVMKNPAGYLFVVGRDRGRRSCRSQPVPFSVTPDATAPWVEPALSGALWSLPERERVVVLLLHGYGLPMSSVAEILGVTKSTIQTHCERGMRKLRQKLGAA